MGGYRPNVGGDEDDDGDGAEPGVSDGEEDVARDVRACEVLERHGHHPHRQRQRYQIENPHLEDRRIVEEEEEEEEEDELGDRARTGRGQADRKRSLDVNPHS
ncbi:hypothetical protein Scep_000953 [Stephania cephalantha]|uniref:Uncharacterized protein n=1 Tax=Stephania cephalantha TaxID=152367 RepID=A0AAP0L712_9MAGN